MKLNKLLSLVPFIASIAATSLADPSLAARMEDVTAINAAGSRSHSKTKRHGAEEINEILQSVKGYIPVSGNKVRLN